MYASRPAAQAWEGRYSALLKGHGFDRLRSVGHGGLRPAGPRLDGVVYGGDFVSPRAGRTLGLRVEGAAGPLRAEETRPPRKMGRGM